MTTDSIDMSKPKNLYLGLVALLLLGVLIQGGMGLATHLHAGTVRHHYKIVAEVLLFFSVAFGLLGAWRQKLREDVPWKIPQVQVLLCFTVFFVLGLLAVVFSG